MQNAGAASAYFQLTEEGYTKSYATNVYSHVLLTLRLLPCFQSNARIIETSSNTHYSIDGKHVSPEDMDFAQHLQRKSGFKLGDKFTPTETLYDYARSKLLQIMFVKALQKHLDQNPMYRERHIKADAFHPGELISKLRAVFLKLTSLDLLRMGCHQHLAQRRSMVRERLAQADFDHSFRGADWTGACTRCGHRRVACG